MVGRGHDVSTVLTSKKPVVAKRLMYFSYGGKWNGGHDVIGFQPEHRRCDELPLGLRPEGFLDGSSTDTGTCDLPGELEYVRS